jgi:hypothetical protein
MTRRLTDLLADDGVMPEPTKTWTEGELVAWVDEQSPDFKQKVITLLKKHVRAGNDPIKALCRIREGVEEKRAKSTPTLGEKLMAAQAAWVIGGKISEEFMDSIGMGKKS